MITTVGPPSATRVGPEQATRLLSRLWTPADESLIRQTILGLVSLVESMERYGSQQEREIVRLRAVSPIHTLTIEMAREILHEDIDGHLRGETTAALEAIACGANVALKVSE